MAHVVFAVPFALETSLRFLRAALDEGGVPLSVVSQEPAGRLPAEVRGRLAGHHRIDDGLDAGRIAGAVEALARSLGPADRLLGVLEQLQVPLARVREALGIPGMGVEAARNFRDKARMKERLRAAGVPCARHRLVRRGAEARELAAEVGFPLVLKPPAGAGARSTHRVDREEELEQALAFLAPSEQSPVLVEEFLTGEEHSFDSVWCGGRPRWSSFSHYRPTPLEVLRQPWIQWCVLLPRDVSGAEYEAPRRAGEAALAALGMETGLSHMEWFRRSDGSVAVSEVGARPPGAQITSLLSWAHDRDFYRAWARLMIHGDFDPPERRWAVGAAYLRAQGVGTRVARVSGVEEAARQAGALVVESRLPRPGQPASGTYEGEGYAIVRHRETEVVERALKAIVSHVRVELGS